MGKALAEDYRLRQCPQKASKKIANINFTLSEITEMKRRFKMKFSLLAWDDTNHLIKLNFGYSLFCRQFNTEKLQIFC
ncbi:hypothetical protein SAR03_14100 [Staphylococcus arlettae]|uniref:Transposase n=1 Tax=Staphylococcus arlettae TaxID=29378 RepID=A0ABQ0XUN4_9STAP|nr:hypothetical protein SAR03_14100 [Staphylococcus arlettae]